MLSKDIQHNQSSDLNFNIHKAMFHKLNLSRSQRALASEYYQISIKAELSEEEVFRLSHIWEEAQYDQDLACALDKVDTLCFQELNEEEAISQNRDKRVYLSEYIPTLAEFKIKETEGAHKILDTEKPYVTMLCPDLSGVIHVSITEDNPVSLHEIYQQICERCNRTLGEHEKYIYIGGKPTSPTQS